MALAARFSNFLLDELRFEFSPNAPCPAGKVRYLAR
jgi:hypothetical protein